MVEIIGAEPKQEEVAKNFITVEKEVMVIQINLKTADSIQAYGTIQKAMELASRYYTMVEVQAARKAESDRSLIRRVADSISKH